MIDVAKIRSKLFPRRKPMDRSQEIRRLVGLHGLKSKENWSDYREYLYQRFADHWDIACGYHDAGEQGKSWDFCVRCFTIWGLITEPDNASESLNARFSKQEVQKVIEDIDFS